MASVSLMISQCKQHSFHEYTQQHCQQLNTKSSSAREAVKLTSHRQIT